MGDYVQLAGDGKYQAIQYALGKNKNIVIRQRNWHDDTPLIKATIGGYDKIVDILIKCNANINAKDKDGGTSLMYAASYGHANIFNTLIANKADINMKNNTDKSVLMQAAENGHENIVRMLIDRQVQLDSKDQDGNSALMWAASSGCETVVRVLIEHNADINVKNKTGQSVLMKAIIAGHKIKTWAERSKNIVNILVQESTAIDIDARQNDGGTALLLAASYGQEDVVKILIRSSADINAKNKYGDTALILAAYSGHQRAMETLILASCTDIDIDARNNFGHSASFFLLQRFGRKSEIFLSLNFFMRKNFLMFLSGCGFTVPMHTVLVGPVPTVLAHVPGMSTSSAYCNGSNECVRVGLGSVVRCFEDHYWVRYMLEYIAASTQHE